MELPRDITADLSLRPRASERVRALARWMFYGHLWIGIVVTALMVVLSITGVLLNHKTSLGLMPDVPNEAKGTLEQALSIAELVRSAEAGVDAEVAGAGIDRLDVRPGKGLMKVRFDDRAVTEATVDIHTGAVLHVGERNDVFLEKLHSGEIFGGGWVLLSDFAGVTLVLLLISGVWLWLYPRMRA